jgi:tetratricopeptide (TPR) repeat protein
LLGRWSDSLEASEKAAERGGGSSAVYFTLGYVQRAALIVRRSLEHDPLRPGAWLTLGTACLSAQDSSCAVEAYEQYYRLAPNEAPYFLAIALHRAGRSAEALALTRQHAQAWRDLFGRPDAAPLSMTLFRAMLGEGRAPTSPDLLASLEDGADELQVVQILAELDRGEDAAQVLPRWTAAMRPVLLDLYDHPLAPMRARPEFWALMEREGIAQVWRESGEWPDFCEREPVCERYLR